MPPIAPRAPSLLSPEPSSATQQTRRETGASSPSRCTRFSDHLTATVYCLETEMSRHTLNSWMPTTLPELRTALDEISADLAVEGADADTVYVDARDISLVSNTLTDGSTTLTIVVRENR